MKIRFVCFDFDGTLGDRNKYVHQAMEEYFSSIIEDPVLREAVVQDAFLLEAGGTVFSVKLYPLIRQRYPFLSENAVEDFHYAMWSRQRDKVVMFPDAIETLDILEKKYTLGMITDGKSAAQRGKIEITGIGRYFKAVAVSEEVGCGKPHKEIFDACMKELGAAPGECVYVGDVFSKDIMGALKAGMHPVWMQAYGEVPCDLDIPIIHHLNELPHLLETI